MAGRKLTEEERANFAARNAASKASSAADKAKAAGVNKVNVKARTAEEIDAAIAKAKADPKFQKTMEKFQATQAAKGTQADHHVTAGKNVSKVIGRGLGSGGVLGLTVAAVDAYNHEAKRISDMKKEIS